MQVGAPVVGVDHRQVRSVRVGRGDVGLDDGAAVGVELGELGQHVAEAVVGIDADFVKGICVLGEQLGEEDPPPRKSAVKL